jgi:REP element-mobilizing transposase RayT
MERPLFITFRLYDSLPANRPFPKSNLTSGKAFAAMDRLLDEARTGPMLLRQPEVAEIVRMALQRGVELKRFELHAWVIMPNHVHLLLTAHMNPARLLGSLKGSTARWANEFLGQTGKPFWQDESYDRLVRDNKEFERIRGYIEQNPVRAGLARTPEEYPWSSARRPERPPQAEGLPHNAPTTAVELKSRGEG